MTFEYLHPQADEVIGLLVVESMAKIGKREGFPCKRTILNWCDKDEAFRAAVNASLMTAGHAAADEHRHVSEQLAEGSMEPEVARVLHQGHRWEAKVRVPKVYGDKMEHAGTLTLEQLVMQATQGAAPE